MRTFFCSSFSKDLSKIENPAILAEVGIIIDLIEAAENLRFIPDIRKMKGSKTAFRIRLGDYRIGIHKLKNGIEFTRILHRRDIYKFFPR